MHEKNAVSAIVGGLIILALLFTIITPLFILLQNSYALFLNESNSRRIFDNDRMSESLKVEVSQDTSTRELILILDNDGPIHINVIRIWALDTNVRKSVPSEGPCLNQLPISLPPGMNVTVSVQTCVNGFTGSVQFLAVTERGRIFSASQINLVGGGLSEIQFPYTLTVSIINMKKGRWYEVYVEPLGVGGGNPEKFTHKATAANENVTVAFGVVAGVYEISLYENGKLVDLGGQNPQIVEIPATTAVIFTLNYQPYTTIDLQPIIVAPSKVNKKKVDQIFVHLDILLPLNANESVMINDIPNTPIRIQGGGAIDSCNTVSGGYILQPGQIGPIGACTINVNSDFTIIMDRGTIGGYGVITGRTYVNAEGTFKVRVVAD